MQAFAPFEQRPVLAVAVSGGPDSLALCLVADRWARGRGGRVEAFTVDHRLRPESTAEARQVGRWLKKRGIAHRILVWRGRKPASGLPAAARAARYRLLIEAAASRGIIHLLLAHHLDDQAETLLLRLARGSGVDGLAAMSPVAELEALRLLRPLLAVPKARLVATLESMKQHWVEDPSNRAQSSARARLRRALVAEGLTTARLGETAGRLGRARAALDLAVAALAARAAEIHPGGFIWLDRAALLQAPDELRLRLLARCLMSVGGEEYPPRLERLERLARELADPAARGHTLHGCRAIPAGDRLLICREPAAVAPQLSLPWNESALWDRRFRVRARAGPKPGGLGVGALGVRALGAEGWLKVNQGGKCAIPRAAGIVLPALCDKKGLLAVPHLGWARVEANGRAGRQAGKIPAYSAVFAPPTALAPAAFAIVSALPRPHLKKGEGNRV